ncbi:hypothetical protein Nepgr_030562 [Nepenthes gracilis]|uniref:Uncharacterized protein n=1 Tax=Nepenthes gracilis TaxID=150966 RepID=A0AAD3TGD0_NEPGR|nr:hypothetical protein Nepgr_030562 [Nepenthes gracilis]
MTIVKIEKKMERGVRGRKKVEGNTGKKELGAKSKGKTREPKEETVTLGPSVREGEHVFGVAHVFASFNDTFIYVTDLSGRETLVRITVTRWDEGKSSRDESSPYAAMLAAQDVAQDASRPASFPAKPEKPVEFEENVDGENGYDEIVEEVEYEEVEEEVEEEAEEEEEVEEEVEEEEEEEEVGANDTDEEGHDAD